MYLQRKLRSESGFTIAELLIAGFILVFALIPITRMFDTSFSGIRFMEKAQKSVEGAKAVMEEIRSMPFYEPYRSSYGDVDIDDHFWGDRSPTNANPRAEDSTPDWESIPEVEYHARGSLAGYEAFRFGVQMAYLNDDTGVATMKDDWEPRKPGKDRPTDNENIALHLALIKVNAYWLVDDEEKQYTMEAVITDSAAIYNLGISSIEVLGPDSVMDSKRPHGAAHWPDVVVEVEIKGWGFKADEGANLNASIVRDKNKDIPIALTYKSSDTLRGTLILHNTGTKLGSNEVDWYPRAAIGPWSVRVNQDGLVSTYLYQGFIVQYPKPVIHDFYNVSDSKKEALNSDKDVSIKVVGGPFVHWVKNPAVRLIRYGASGEILNQVDGTITGITSSPSSAKGYTISPNCTLTATFDFTGAAPGDYQMQVVNTDEPTLLGHVASDPIAAVYTVKAVFPEITDVYVYGKQSKTRFAYSGINNPWPLMVEGRSFNESGDWPTVEVYLCSGVTDGEPSGEVIQGSVVSVLQQSNILARFDFAGRPSGFYKVFVRNCNDGGAGWTDDAPFELRSFSPAIDSFTYTADGFYENYYDIPSVITGASFEAATAVVITNGTDEYDLEGEYAVAGESRIDVNLNLIGCSNKDSWKLRVYFDDARTVYEEKAFAVTLGPAKILPVNATKPAIRIKARRGSSTQWNAETGTTNNTKAWGWSGTPYLILWWTDAYATFEIKGQGFPLPGNGKTNLRVWGSGLDENHDCDLDTTLTDRAKKTVVITSPEWKMPRRKTQNNNITVKSTANPSSGDTYNSRWRLKE